MFITALDLENAVRVSKHQNRWARRKKRLCSCLNFVPALPSAPLRTTSKVVIQWRIWPSFFQVKEKKLETGLLANKKIRSFSAHLFYAPICSVLIIIKQHRIFPLRNRVNQVWLLIHLYALTFSPLFSTISVLFEALSWHFHQTETSLKLPVDWPSCELSPLQ